MKIAVGEVGLSQIQAPYPEQLRTIQKKAVIGGVELAWLENGLRSNPSVVFLHGLTGNAYECAGAAALISDAYFTISPDLRGHGRSHWNLDGEYSIQELAIDVINLLDHLEIGRASIVGASIGGLVAMHAAALAPERINSVSMIDLLPSVSENSYRKLLQVFAGQPFSDIGASLEWLKSGEADFDSRGEEIPHKKSFFNVSTAYPNYTHDPASLRMLEYQKLESYWAAANSVTCPVLLIKGKRSRLVAEPSIQELKAKISTVVVKEIAEAGHSVQIEKPIELAAAITPFLNDILGRHSYNNWLSKTTRLAIDLLNERRMQFEEDPHPGTTAVTIEEQRKKYQVLKILLTDRVGGMQPNSSVSKIVRGYLCEFVRLSEAGIVAVNTENHVNSEARSFWQARPEEFRDTRYPGLLHSAMAFGHLETSMKAFLADNGSAGRKMRDAIYHALGEIIRASIDVFKAEYPKLSQDQPPLPSVYNGHSEVISLALHLQHLSKG